jgi:hypothetical protein
VLLRPWLEGVGWGGGVGGGGGGGKEIGVCRADE